MRAIVFSLSGCPAGWLGAYGNEWVATPNLDRLTAESVVFDRHISDCPHPDAARAAWMTGMHQGPQITLAFDSRLTSALHNVGVRTILVRANHADTDGPPSFYAGWDEVFDARPDPADSSPLDVFLRTLPSLLDRLQVEPRWLLWIETDRLIPPWVVKQDVFDVYIAEDDEVEDADAEVEEEEEDDDDEDQEVEVDRVEPEEPQAIPESKERIEPFSDPPVGPFDRTDLLAWEWLHSTFAAVVTTLDAELGKAFEMFRERGLDQTATWLVTSDFGHPLGEHGQVGMHRPWLHEELVHLPLIVRLPGTAEAGRRVFAFSQPADVAATLLDLFGVVVPVMDGFSLLPLAHGQVEKLREDVRSALELEGVRELALRTNEWALLLPITPPSDDPPREPILFQKPDDLREVNDMRARNIETADELEAALHKRGSP
jgi:arylsulfatase A-like enzyme